MTHDPGETKPQFNEGEMVRVISYGATDHTRVPRYLRGKTGRMNACRAIFNLPTQWRVTRANAHNFAIQCCLKRMSYGDRMQATVIV